MLASKALAAAVSQEPAYIEDVFSTYLYTGNGSTQTITNGIDLAGEGGLVWLKGRSGALSHALYDTARGATKDIVSNTSSAETTQTTGLTAFSGTGFSIGSLSKINTSATTYASWTFRKAPKFFDIVTYTGNGVVRTIPHNLGSVPGCIIIKSISNTSNWEVYHRGLSATNKIIRLNATGAETTALGAFNGTAPTSTEFTLGGASTTTNVSGYTYVAYLFAHNAGGFGADGSENVISCGSYTGNGSATGPVITLGYEPQWLLVKNSTGTGDWNLIDNMRGFVVGGADAELNPNLSNAESSGTFVSPTATGFQINTTDAGYNTSSATYIYIAIRRGPMKVPESGTQVFSPSVYTTAPASPLTVTTNFPVDLSISQDIAGSVSAVIDRLRSVSASSVKYLSTQNTSAEGSTTGISLQNNTAIVDSGFWAGFAYKPVYWNFRRAPGFFDVVCYTGTGVATTQSHNLAAVPELMIVKRRNATGNEWTVYTSNGGISKLLFLNLTDGYLNDSNLWVATPTSTVFSLPGTAPTYDVYLNTSGGTYVAYLFATLAGVSKVGSYTGSGTTKQIDCGFTAGARFVLIKRTDSTGDWYVYDSARGIVAGNDPYILLNSTAAEVTSTDYIDSYSAGFEISSTAPAAINANGGTFIFLAIA